MVKLKHLKCYDAALVPDHIVQQVDEACEKMLSAMRFGFGGHIEGAEPIDPEPKRLPATADAAKHAAE